MNTLAGTGALVRLILRRDRVLMPLWVVLMALVPMFLGSSIKQLYPTAAAVSEYARENLGNSTFIVLYGRIYDTSLGGVTFWRASSGMLIIGIISMLVVIRHTRVEEEAGRRELVGSAVVGRHAGLAAALVATIGANLVLAVLLALGLTGLGLPAGGSFAAGLAWAATGGIFAAVGALVAQLTEGAGAARGVGVTVAGAAFLLRAAGDVAGEGADPSWVSWLSPLGWMSQMRAFGQQRWWVLVPAVALIALLVAVAFALQARRDVGAGLLPPRLGPAEAAAGLRSPLALAWRLHRGGLIGWTAGFAVLGAVFGGVAKSAQDMLAGNQQLMEIFERMGGESALSDVVIAGTMGVSALIVSGYAVQATLRMRTEEAALRSEPVLVTRVGRISWALSHLVFAIFGPLVAMAAEGLVTGLVYGASVGDPGREIPRGLAAALVQLPAVWVLAGLTTALFGLRPRLAPAVGWAGLGVCLFLGLIGAAVQLSQAVLDVSPFTHIPKIPGGDLAVVPLVVLIVIAGALLALGLAAFRRRDVPVV
ncbi:ABC transporter permease [Planotetraspora kaengkrachanensis]|uniref:Exporter of polyketide antibiotics n=1 Tax=Planotetraspora kaengkrachanensis TaxID=575193 RepID=A0A8J3Q1H6_9ACTN|nr:ABC transporter permease [Planotetraspora kaengkrachanensis]GIG84833.1 exporter of polyketide antibiotics [Planotetraspora kaengkrachanensis]